MNKIVVLLLTILLIYSCANQEQPPSSDEETEKVITENAENQNIIDENNDEKEVNNNEGVNKNETEINKTDSPSKERSKSKSPQQDATIDFKKEKAQKNISRAIIQKNSNTKTVQIELPIKLDDLEQLLKGKGKNIVLSSSLISSTKKASDDDDDDGILGFVDNNPVDTSAGKAKIKMGAFDEIVGESRSGEAVGIAKGEAVPEYIRKPKPFAEDFTGYRIEIMTVYNKPLSLNDDLFKQFGGVTYRKKTDNSTTYYIGDFKDKIAVEDYMEKVLKNRYPGAKGVRFKDGEEVKYK